MARALTDQEKSVLSELNSRYNGLVRPFLVKDTLVVVRAASPGDLQRYKDKIAKSFSSQNNNRRNSGGSVSLSDAERELALSSIAHPTREQFLSLVEGPDPRPGFIGTAATVAEDLTNEGVEELEGN